MRTIRRLTLVDLSVYRGPVEMPSEKRQTTEEYATCIRDFRLSLLRILSKIVFGFHVNTVLRYI